MSTTASETSTQPAAAGPVTDSQDHLTGFFDYPDPDIIFRSSDLHEFRLRKVYVVESSTVLRHLLTQTTPEARLPDAPPTPAEDGSASLPVVQLPDSSLILSSLFSFVFPVLSVLPPEVDQVMELISVAQKYKMDSVVARIRDRTSSKWAKLIPEESALRAFDLARRYGLQEEATTAARRTLGLSITMQSLEDKLDGMSGTTLYELWKYHQEVKRILKANIAEFILSEKFNEFVATIRQGKACCAYYSKQTPSVPQWLEDYLNFVTSFPGYSLDPTKFHTALRRHISISLSSGKARSFVRCTACANITEASVRSFWLGLEATAMRSMEVADDYLHPGEGTSPHDRENLLESATPSLNRFNARDGDAVLRSSDLTNFRVHKSILEIASPLFRDMFSLPQSGDVETVGGIPILHVSEEAEVLNSLITMLYPVPPATPDSWDKLLPLLSAAQKYDMDHILSSLRSSISREDIPPPAGKETFRVYAIASKLRLDSEVKLSARLTLHHPMTFEFLGEDLPLFEGASLYDLAQLRIRLLRVGWEATPHEHIARHRRRRSALRVVRG
ncbi:hypothetical protein BC834DRAFT_270692 [Gloeopeniophorella convolvens]|nr:hypothetical protein BC834DRAFT_270692 [Gloeopeniophorella convolvens]